MSYYGAVPNPDPNPRPTSVLVIAIIGIILGAIGVACSPFALVPYFVNIGPPNPAIDIIKGSPGNMAFMIGSLAIGVVNAIVLLAGSIGSVKMRPWGRTALIVYAIVAILGVIVGLIFNILVFLPALSALRTTSAAGAAAYTGGLAGGIGGTIGGLILPAAILIVMYRPHVVNAFKQAAAS
jgi:hypothetical protein